MVPTEVRAYGREVMESLREALGGPWPSDVVANLCHEVDLVHVVDPFVSTTVTPEQTYFRLHGTTGARHVYSDAELAQLAAMLPAAPSHPPYVLFNNLPRIDDSRRFRQILSRRRSPRPGF